MLSRCALALSLTGAFVLSIIEPVPARDATELSAAAANVTQTVAHRGASAVCPENTEAAYRAALAAGATAIEVDVRTARDGTLVILHDETLDRTTDGTGRVHDEEYSDLYELDAGAWFDPKFAGERIPSLEEVLVLCQGKIDVLLDLKESGPEFARRVADGVRHFAPAGHGTIVGVRSVEQARLFRRLLPGARQLGLIPAPDTIEAFTGAGVEMIRLWPRWLKDGSLVERVRKAGAGLHLNGTTGEVEEVEALLAFRPDSLSSDDPARLVETLAEIVAAQRTEPAPSSEPLSVAEREALDVRLAAELERLNRQIENDDQNVALYSSRGDVHFFRGEFSEAVRDYEKMVELDPSRLTSHWRRGIAYFYARRYRYAAGQFEIYHTFDDVDRENGIWRYLSYAKAYSLERARKELLKYTKDDREPFPDVYRMFAGQMTGDEVLARIAAAKIPEVEREKRRFYAHLYIGLNEFIEGRETTAREHLAQAVANSWGPTAGFGPSYMWHVGRVHHDLLKKRAKRDEDLSLSVLLERSVLYPGEPAFVTVQITNRGQEPRKLNLGWNAEEGLVFEIRQTGGKRVSRGTRSAKPGLSSSGRITLPPGETVSRKYLLNKWVPTTLPVGDYRLSCSVRDIGGDGLTLSATRELHITDKAEDRKRLLELFKQYAANAAILLDDSVVLLSHSRSPFVLPYLVEVLRDESVPEHRKVFVAKGLGRVATVDAVNELVSLVQDAGRAGTLNRLQRTAVILIFDINDATKSAEVKQACKPIVESRPRPVRPMGF